MTLGQLICGSPGATCVASTTLDHLKGSIDRFASKAIAFLNEEFTEEAQSYGAFCARVVLENSCAALVGRLDPFRLIYLAEFQTQDKFEYGKPTKSGFKWTGDVLPDDKGPQEMWGAEHDAAKVSRALFSQYADHVYWQPAHGATLDFLASGNMEIFKNITEIEPEKFVGYTRGRCAALYSTLSKGVHWDFFVSSIVLDEGTVKDAIRETLLILGGVGLISHFVPTAFRTLDHTAAVEAYTNFRGSFV